MDDLDDPFFEEDDDPSGDLVDCVVCGKSLWAEAHQCHHCGTYFKGQAWQHAVAGSRLSWSLGPFWTVVAILVLFACFFAFLFMLVPF